MQNFNKLTPAQTERLSMLAEEAGEVVLAIGKILRHGYYSTHPDNMNLQRNNRTDLQRELGDLNGVVNAMIKTGDIDGEETMDWAYTKMKRARPYLHHQTFDLNDNITKDA
jgi:NTP pyrophosphatase (non-canonical NTP hydrolase)